MRVVATVQKSGKQIAKRRILIAQQGRNIIPLLGLMVLFVSLWIYLGTQPGRSTLNHDEMWGATAANLSLFDAIVFTLRFDIHPPLYYAQLNLWSAFGHSDQWLQLNSAVWLVGAATIVFHIIRKNCDILSAGVAAALMLTSPMLVGYSLLVRMYTFLCFLTAVGIMLSDNILLSLARHEVIMRREWIMLFIVQAITVYSYALGFIISGATYAYILLEGRRLGASRTFFLRLTEFNMLLGLVALPAIGNSLVRQAGHGAKPTYDLVLSSATELLVGEKLAHLGSGTAILFLALAIALGAAIRLSPRSRNLAIAFLALPMTFVFAVSYALRPVWITYIFLFCVPVFHLALGYGIYAAQRRNAWVKFKEHRLAAITAAAVLIVLTQTLTIIKNARVEKVPNYPALLARYEGNPGDCIAALDTFDVFWGLSRYIVGAHWNGGLRVQGEPVRRWKTILASLPRDWAKAFHLIPTSDRVSHAGITVIAGYPSRLDDNCRRLFVAGKETDFESESQAFSKIPVQAESGPVAIRGPISNNAQ